MLFRSADLFVLFVRQIGLLFLLIDKQILMLLILVQDLDLAGNQCSSELLSQWRGNRCSSELLSQRIIIAI
jgi:hypothetical protein